MRIRTSIHRVAVAAVACAGVLGAQAAAASATTFRGQIDDPIEHSSDRSRDIKRVVSTFDSATGRWAVAVTFAAAPTPATSARLYLSLLPPKSQCAGVIGMQLETGSASARYSQTCLRGSMQTIQRTLSASVLTLQVTDPATIGLTPRQLGQTRLSEHRLYDYVPATTMFAPDAPATLRVGPTTRLRISSKGILSLPLTGISRRASATIRLTAGGHALARRSLTIKPGLPTLHLQLSAGARRHVSARGTRATLTTKLTDTTGATRTIKQTITLLK